MIAGIVGKAVQQQRQIYHEHYSSCAPAQADWGDPDMEDGALASLICCPLIHQGTVLGALTMGVPSANQYITDTLNTASMVSTILAAMLDRWKRIHQLHQSQRAALNIAQDIEASRAELQKSSEALHERSEALQNSNRDLESFAYAASHDLQEPLRKIIGFTELLEAELGSQLKEVPLEYMGYIKLSAQRMTHLIQGLLKYSRAATAVHELESCNLNSLFEDAIDALSLSIAQSGAKIEWHGELPILLGYPVLLRQLFQNLLENAIKFRGDQPLMIEVQSQRVNHEGAEYYQVSVSGMT